MGDVVNLRRVRKAKQRSADEQASETNRRAYGQTKAEREQTAAVRSLTGRLLDGHRRDEPM